jgi:tetratricopeptide (TPR) repeat protein
MALPMANAAVEIATQGSDQLDLPSALYCRGHLLRKSGNSEQALPDLQAALRGFQRMGDRGSEGMCFGELGEHHHYTGDTKRARRCYENAQAIALELDNKTDILRGHRRLAWLHMDAGDWEHAEAELRCGLRVAHEVGDLPGLKASLIGTLGTVAALAGQFEAALTQFQEAEHMYEQHGNNAQGQRCRVNIANVLERLNRIDEAIEICEALKQEQGMEPQVRHTIAVMEMKLHIRRENWSEALALGDCALEDLENLQAWDTTVPIHAYRAICTAALGGDPEPHLARAKSLMAKLDLAEGSSEGEIVTAAANQVQDILRQRAIDPTDAC